MPSFSLHGLALASLTVAQVWLAASVWHELSVVRQRDYLHERCHWRVRASGISPSARFYIEEDVGAQEPGKVVDLQPGVAVGQRLNEEILFRSGQAGPRTVGGEVPLQSSSSNSRHDMNIYEALNGGVDPLKEAQTERVHDTVDPSGVVGDRWDSDPTQTPQNKEFGASARAGGAFGPPSTAISGSDCCSLAEETLPGCDEPECADAVCEHESYCCDSWEEYCVELALANCAVCRNRALSGGNGEASATATAPGSNVDLEHEDHSNNQK